MIYVKKIIFSFAGLSFFLLDRIFKQQVLSQTFEKDFLIFSFLKIGFYKNTGIAFGVPFEKIFLPILIIFILICLFFFLLKAYQKKEFFLAWAIGLVVLGGLSNLIDRFFYGFVIDYINFLFFPYFNLADLMIVGGILLLVKEVVERAKALGY